MLRPWGSVVKMNQARFQIENALVSLELSLSNYLRREGAAPPVAAGSLISWPL